MTNTSLSGNINLNAFSLYAGKIALGNMFDESTIARLKAENFTHAAIFRTGEEDATQWRQAAQDAGLEWLWMPVHQTLSATDIQRGHLHQYLTELAQTLKEGARIYFFCDDSMHRCALMFYALCHACRIPSSSAYPVLHSVPELDANALTRDSLHWAAKLGATAPTV